MYEETLAILAPVTYTLDRLHYNKPSYHFTLYNCTLLNPQCWCIITVTSEHGIKLYQLRLVRSGVEVNYKVLLVLIISVNDPADNV